MDITGMTSKEAFEMGLASGPICEGNVDVGLLDTKLMKHQYVNTTTITVESSTFYKIPVGQNVATDGSVTTIYSVPVISAMQYIELLTNSLVACGIPEDDITPYLELADSQVLHPQIGVTFKMKNNTFKVIAGVFCSRMYTILGSSGNQELKDVLWVSGTSNQFGYVNELYWLKEDGTYMQLTGMGIIPCTTMEEGGYYKCQCVVPEPGINSNGVVIINTSFTLALIDISHTLIYSSYQLSFYQKYKGTVPGMSYGRVTITYSFPMVNVNGMAVLFNQNEYSEADLQVLGVSPIKTSEGRIDAFYMCVGPTANFLNTPSILTDLDDNSKYFYGWQMNSPTTLFPVYFVLNKGTMLGVY